MRLSASGHEEFAPSAISYRRRLREGAPLGIDGGPSCIERRPAELGAKRSSLPPVLAAFTALLNGEFAAPKSTLPDAPCEGPVTIVSPCCSSEGVAMIVEIYGSSPSEICRAALQSPARMR